MKLPFDEAQLLRDNLPYLQRALQLQGLAISSTSDPAAVAAAQAAGVDISVAVPGSPVVQFTAAGAAAGAPAAAESATAS
jgi:hypothetical protein